MTEHVMDKFILPVTLAFGATASILLVVSILFA
jgi:hypothetical protein